MEMCILYIVHVQRWWDCRYMYVLHTGMYMYKNLIILHSMLYCPYAYTVYVHVCRLPNHTQYIYIIHYVHIPFMYCIRYLHLLKCLHQNSFVSNHTHSLYMEWVWSASEITTTSHHASGTHMQAYSYIVYSI